MAVFMEKTTRKNSKNSSKPSSQTGKDESAKTRVGGKSKGLSQNNQQSNNTRTKVTIKKIKVVDCETCGEDLSKTKCDKHERRTIIDIIFEKKVTHFDSEIKTCVNCGEQTKGRFPGGVSGPLQYGAGIKAYMLNMLIAHMMSLNRIQKLVKTIINQVISEATMLKYVLQLHLALENWEKTAINQLLNSPAIHVDETSMRVDKKNHWIHVYSSGNVTLKFLQPGRGIEAIENIGIIPRYNGVIIHDCLAAYLSYNHCKHGLCGSHLLRELTFIVDSNGYKWASNMKSLLSETCKIVSKREEKILTESEYKNVQKRYRNILTRGEKELPPIPKRIKGQRGRIAKTDAQNLWERLKEHEEAVLLFAKDPDVAFTNNRAERDLRMSKVKQKVSGCFRSGQFAKAYCRISSYLQTMANEGYNPLVAIQLALSGKLYAKMG
ncbi:MAG: IS66 family transposase [Candidatus Omnitrophica bacterium]|nr:IS66 family transposase [Candidatus Omnitrophota bacterium]